MNEQKSRDVADLALEHLREMQELVGDSNAEAKQAFLELYAWIPETALQAVLDAYHANGAKEGNVPPFFSEVTTYEILGKEEGRTLRALMHNLGEALGFTRMELHQAMRESDDEDESRKMLHKDDPFTADDFDALELMIRREGVHFYDRGGDARVQVQRALRAVRAAREVYAAPHDPGWEYMRVTPKDLRIGDEIVRRGAWNRVLGFFHDEDEKRWTEEGLTFSETPVGSEERNYRGEPTWYLVKTSWSPRMGERLRGHEELAIRRRHDQSVK